ncbi:hypothetical protein Rs2_41057 [Raphanus sativus]|nr:hypothetical protein Rs2_41057 [Raphanus sativus]
MSKLFRSGKKSSKKKAPVTSSPDCNQDEELLVPKAEFELPPNAAERDAYWRASSDRIKPPGEEKFPICRARKTGTHLPSKTTDLFLETLRKFAGVSDAVEFRIPRVGESADHPPEGYFTCYEAVLWRCRIWFLIPEIIVRVLDRFQVSFNQLSHTSFEILIGLVILSYERGLSLTTDHFEALLRLQYNRESASWRLNAASVADEFILMFWTVLNPLPYISVVHPWPRDIMEVRDAMRSGDHWWTSFIRQRVRKAIRLAHSDFEAEGEIDFAPVDHLLERVPVERSPKLPQRNKDIEVEDHDFPVDDSPLPGWDPSLGFGDGSGSSDAQIPNFDDFFSGLLDHPVPLSFAEDTEERPEVLAETSRVVNGAMNHLGSALLDNQRESRIWCFKAEKISPSEEAGQAGDCCRDAESGDAF